MVTWFHCLTLSPPPPSLTPQIPELPKDDGNWQYHSEMSQRGKYRCGPKFVRSWILANRKLCIVMLLLSVLLCGAVITRRFVFAGKRSSGGIQPDVMIVPSRQGRPEGPAGRPQILPGDAAQGQTAAEGQVVGPRGEKTVSSEETGSQIG